MLEKVILLDESIERFEHGRFFCAVLGHLSFLIFPFFESGRIYQNGAMLPERQLNVQHDVQ
jgi:hypothetical protein